MYRVPSARPRRRGVLLSLSLLLASTYLLLTSLLAVIGDGELPIVSIGVGLGFCLCLTVVNWLCAIGWDDYRALLTGRPR